MGHGYCTVNMINRASQRSKVISIVAGGRFSRRFLPSIRAAAVIIGVDYGAWRLVKEGVAPDIAIGDFDSVTAFQKKQIHDRAKKYIEYLPEKDMTDLELAVEEAMRLRPKEVRIYGALGGRFDHAFGAIQLLTRLVSHNINGEIVDNLNKINIVRRQLVLPSGSGFQYVSVIPLHKNAMLSLDGFAYSVSRCTFAVGSTLGISNEIVDESATISVHSGQVLVVQSNDRPVR